MSADFVAFDEAALRRRRRARVAGGNLLTCLVVRPAAPDVFSPVACGLAPHPAFVAAMEDLGAVRAGERMWRVNPLRVPLARLLRVVPPHRLVVLPLEVGSRREMAHRVAALLSSFPSWKARVGDLSPKGSQTTDGPLVACRAASGRLVLTLFHADEPRLMVSDARCPALPFNRLRAGEVSRPVLLSAPLAACAAALARSSGFDVWDRSPAGELAALAGKMSRFQSVHPVPFTPGVLAVNDPAVPLPLLVSVDLAASMFPHAPADPLARPLLALTRAAGEGRPGLLPHQDVFVSRYLLCERGMVCAMPTGSGKTRAALAALAALSSRESGVGETLSGYRAMVVVPSAVREQWAAELAALRVPFRVLRSAADDLTGLDAEWGPLVLLASFDVAKEHAGLAAMRFNDLVVDEATVLFNPTSARSAALWRLRGRSRRALLLTATPNGRSRDHFGVLACFAAGDPDLLGASPLSRRRAKAEEVLGPLVFSDASGAPLPDVSHRSKVVRLADAHRERYLAAVDQLERGVLSGVSYPKLMGAFRSVRQACVLDGEAAGEKVRVTADLAASAKAAGRRVLVFTDFASVIPPAVAQLRDRGLVVSVLASSRSHASRSAAARALAQGSVDVLVVGPAGHVGLNLQAADVVIHLDVPVDLASFKQRNGRAARVGSVSASVDVFVPVAEGTVEPRLLAAYADNAIPFADMVSLALAR